MNNIFCDFLFYVSPIFNNCRLDICLFSNITFFSRSKLKWLIDKNKIYVNGKFKRSSYKVNKGDLILGNTYITRYFNYESILNNTGLNIVYEDENLLVINKDYGMIVHPCFNNASVTVMNLFLELYPNLKKLFRFNRRPGIVHRLDKDTTGLLILVKNNKSMNNLLLQFRNRLVKKYYLALVYGIFNKLHGSITLPIRRDLKNRKKMSVGLDNSRYAKTIWRVKETFLDNFTLLELKTRTGRTHQIRAHCEAIGHPIVGDKIYKKSILNLEKSKKFFYIKRYIKRQMLHAYKLNFLSPFGKNRLRLKIDLPKDMKKIIFNLRHLS